MDTKKTMWLSFFACLALAILDSNAADLHLNPPLVQLGTNFYFRSQNPTPECPCLLQCATNLNPSATWTTLAQGIPNQTNYNVVSTANPGFYRLRYKPYIQAPASLYATLNAAWPLTNVQILPFTGTGQLSLAVSTGPLRFGNTNGLSFVSGTNGQPSFTVSGEYAAISNAMSTLIYTGHGAIGATDTVKTVLSNLGTYNRCGDSNSIPVHLNSPPIAHDASYVAGGSLDVAAPGLVSPDIAIDPDGDPLSAIPQNVTGTYGRLIVNADGSLTYRPNSSPASTIYEIFSFGVYDTFGGALHSTSAAQRLVIQIDPVSGSPKVSR